MSASTGAHRGSAPDANWSYALEAHIAWAAAGAPKAALKAQANPKGGKCIMEYDMDAICKHSLKLGKQATKKIGKGALKQKSGKDTYEFRNLPKKIKTAAQAEKLWKKILAQVVTAVQKTLTGQGIPASPNNVFMPTMTGAHTDVLSILPGAKTGKCVTWGAKHNNGKGRWGSMSDAAKSVIAHTNLPMAKGAMDAMKEWMKQSDAAGKLKGLPKGRPSQDPTLGTKEKKKFSNARFDPRIFHHAFMLKGKFYTSFCDYVETRTVGINGWTIDCENKTTANSTGVITASAAPATANLVGVNKANVRSHMPDLNGKTIYIQEKVKKKWVTRFKLSFRIIKQDGTVDDNARPATIIPEWGEKPRGVNLTEGEWKRLGSVLMNEFRDTSRELSPGEAAQAQGVVDTLDLDELTNEMIDIIAQTDVQTFIDEGIFTEGYEDPNTGDDVLEGSMAEGRTINTSRWLQLAGILNG